MTDEGYLQIKIRDLKEEILHLEQTHSDIRHKCEHLQNELDSNSERLKRLDDVDKMTAEIKQNIVQELEQKFKATQDKLSHDVIKSLKHQRKKDIDGWDKIRKKHSDIIDRDAYTIREMLKDVTTWIITFNRILRKNKLITSDDLLKISQETEELVKKGHYRYLLKNGFSYSVIKYCEIK